MEDSIVYISSKSANYSTTYRTLEDIQKELGNKDFFITHRCFITNLKKIRDIKSEVHFQKYSIIYRRFYSLDKQFNI